MVELVEVHPLLSIRVLSLVQLRDARVANYKSIVALRATDALVGGTAKVVALN